VNPSDSESRQIDLIYGLLRLEIRDRVPRKTIRDFTSLLDSAREVEAVMRERRSETTTETSNKVRDKCAYCKNKGHDITTCRKRDRAEKGENDSKPGEPVKVEFRCYGCGNHETKLSVVLSTSGHDGCTDIGFPRVVDRANRTTSHRHHHFRNSRKSLFSTPGPGQTWQALHSKKY
jgi:hypothetical protein